MQIFQNDIELMVRSFARVRVGSVVYPSFGSTVYHERGKVRNAMEVIVETQERSLVGYCRLECAKVWYPQIMYRQY